MPSPARQQYLDLKHRYPDAILLYRLGDFYEMFDQDAEVAAKILGIQLTARTYPRGEGRVPMAGVPHHSVDTYIKRLLDAGYRVALCEQLTEAGKGLVDRDVVRVFTPGTLIEPNMLHPGQNNYLSAVYPSKSSLGLASIDVTTGEFVATEFAGPSAVSELEAELLRLSPVECLVPEGSDIDISLLSKATARKVTSIEPKEGVAVLKRHLEVGSLAGFGLQEKQAPTAAAAIIVAYLNETNRAALDIVDGLRTYSTQNFMTLDRFTRASLDLTPAAGTDGQRWTLLRVLDRTKTTMGARRLRTIIGQPLLDIGELERRLDTIEFLTSNPMLVSQLASRLSKVGDIERIVARVAQRKANNRDLVELRLSLQEISGIRAVTESKTPSLGSLAERLDPSAPTAQLIESAIDLEIGSPIKPGYNRELDELRSTMNDAREAIAALERKEIEATGIKSLRVGYNKVFGYYMEIGKASSHLVPDHYVRQQTLVNAERFFTPEIKEYESRMLGAKERVAALEAKLFEDVLAQIDSTHQQIMNTAAAIAEVDVFRSLAEVALSNNYVRPVLEEGSDLRIIGGRHPVVEAATDAAFVPNDCCFDQNQRILVLTGPNMGGKSTMLRMVASVVLMAQIGSFVPAEEASIGLVDRIFSRVGAQDDIAAGQSTFMTEMVETSNILHHATSKSLLVLDEIGRGTSTYDGLAIARAVIEYIHSRLGARTLFATHYHELTDLAEELDQVRNFHTAVADHNGKVIFLHKVVPGGAERSFGIHVARLAGLPHSVTVRADRILRQLEKSANGSRRAPGPQMALFSDPDLAPKSETETVAIRVLDQLLSLDLSNTTPLEALEQLHKFQEEGRASG